MALSTLPHQKILAALRQGDREAVGRTLFPAMAERDRRAQAWIGRTKTPTADIVAAR